MVCLRCLCLRSGYVILASLYPLLQKPYFHKAQNFDLPVIDFLVPRKVQRMAADRSNFVQVEPTFDLPVFDLCVGVWCGRNLKRLRLEGQRVLFLSKLPDPLLIALALFAPEVER